MSWVARVGELVRHGSYGPALELLVEVGAKLEDGAERASALAKRAELLDGVFGRRGEAADAWEAAYELDPTRLEWLVAAREARVALGEWGVAAGWIEREIGASQDQDATAALYRLLGDVRQELRDDAAAQECYRQACQLGEGDPEAAASLADIEAGDAEARLDEAKIAAASAQGEAAARALVRAARLARRLDDPQSAALLEQALHRAPGDPLAGAMLDDRYAHDPAGLLERHRAILGALSGAAAAQAARAMAARWSARFEDREAALTLWSAAGAAAPDEPAAALAAAQLALAEGGAQRALELIDGALARLDGGSPAEAVLLGAALDLSLAQGADSAATDGYALRLRARNPEHPSILALSDDEVKVGESPMEASVSEQETSDNELESPDVEIEVGEDEDAPEIEMDVAPEALADEAEAAALDEEEAYAPDEEDASPADEEQASAPLELTAEQRAQLEELDQQIEKYADQKRWSDVIKGIVAKADIHVDPAEKVELYAEAGRMYLDKSSNQAEAIKCFESVLEHDTYNLEAIEQLKEMYEKRRDWESLVRIRQRAAKLMDEADRLFEYVEIAELATQRLRKPELCIELWQAVLEEDADNPEALGALTQLYERAREWEPLARVLDRHVAQISDEKELKAALQKLGMIYADKVGDDEGAVRAFSRLLALDPDDRRAQEQLKRRYVALKAWDDLEAFYGATDKWDELIRTLEREAESKDASDEERTDLLFRAARLWIDKNDKPDRAARAYEKVLAKDENNLDAALALSPIYEEAGDARKLVQVYEVRLIHAQEPVERVHLLREAGLLYEEKLRKPEDAFARFVEAFKTDPTQEVIRDDVSRLAEATNGWDTAIAAYGEAIDAATDPDVQVELRLQLGRLLTQVEKIEDAIAQYRAVYDAQGDNVEAIGALEQLYRHTEKYRELLEVYERRMELEEDFEVRRQLAYARASLWENELSDPANAIDAYLRIIEEWGDDESDAYAALDSLYEGSERWADLAATLERRIDLGPESTEELAALKFRQANVLSEHLEEKERALEIYREVLMLQPEHEGARQRLEAFLDDELLGTHAATILEPIYEMQGQWEPLIRALEVLAAGADEPERKLDLLSKIGEVCGTQIEDHARSFEAFGRGFAVMPESEETLVRLEVLALEHERFEDLVQLVERLAADTTDPALSRALWLKAAQIHDTQRGQVDAAVNAYNQVLESDPGDGEVLDALDGLYRRTERWRDLLGVVRRKAELADDPDEQEALLAQNAMIYEEMLEEPENAIRVYNDILELDPTSQGALIALDRLYERLERWSDLADNIGRQLTIAEQPEDQTALMLRLAALRETQMNAVDAAIEIYREVLERDPTTPEALEALERLIQSDQHQVLIAGILEPIYRDSNEFGKLIQVHEIQAAHAEGPDMRVELLHQIAELHEVALDDYGNAFNSYARALAEDAADLNTQEQLERLARATGAFEQLAMVYEQRVEGLEDVPLACQLYVKAAVIREEQLADLDTAIQHYQRVLGLDADHIESATALERLFHMAERYEDLAKILLRKSEILDIPDDQKDHLFRAAAIYEEILERPEAAIEVYKKVLEVDMEELRALDKLIELHLILEKWQDLLGFYERKADIVFDPDEKKMIYVEVGAVYEREIGDGVKAIDTYQRILEIDPDDLIAIGRLDALYQASGNWEELRAILEREADLAHDPNEVISYRYRIADLWDHRLGDPARAVDIYRDILAVVPDHRPTLEALERMIQEGKEPNQAALVLEPIYSQYGESERLVHVLEVQIAHEADPIHRVELLHRVAELQEIQLDQNQPAFDAFARALPLDNANEQTMANLERLADELGAWSRVTELYDAEIEKLKETDPVLLIETALRVAQIYFIQVGDVDSAIQRYCIVLEADDRHVQAIEALDQLYEQTQRWPQLADILQKEVELSPSPEDVLSFQFRLGQVYQHYLNRVDDAIEQYREILAAAPEHGQALSALEMLFAEGVQPIQIGEILEPLYRMSETWEKLVGVQQVQLQHQQDADERIQMMHRIAEIAEDRATDHQLALDWMQRALLEGPRHEHTASEVERLAAMLDRWDQLSSTYADVLEQAQAAADVETVIEVGRRQARIYEHELGDVERAVHAHLFVLKASPRQRDALENLDRIFSSHGAHEALQETLKKRIVAAEDDIEKVELSYRLGQVLENELGRIDEAVSVYQGLLADLDPEHEASIKALQNIYTEKQDWPSLFATFQKELEVVLGDTARSDVTAKMAYVAASYLGDTDKAIEMWKEVLELRGEDPEALNALGNLYASLERWAELVEILDREVTVAEDDEVRCQIFSDMARTFYVRLQKERNAIDSWERVLDIDAANSTALFGLAEIYANSEQSHERVDTLQRLLEVGAATLEDATLETVYMQLGSLYEVTLQQPFDAVDTYRRVLDVNPRNFVALDSLERLHRAEGEWVDAIGVMERRQEGLDEPQHKIQVLLAIAEAWATKANDPDRGTSAYERILELEPMHRFAFDQLETLHTMAARWEALVDLYLARVDHCEEAEDIIDLLSRIARTYEQNIKDLAQAQDALMLAWEQDFTNDNTADELERVASLTKEWNEPLNLANTTLQELQGQDHGEYRQIKIALCLRAAKWYGHYLNHPEYAVPYYKQILSLDPTNYAAMQSQADLHRHLGQWQQLAQMLGRMSEIVKAPHERAEVFNQMGELCQDQLAMPHEAPGYFKQARDADPKHLGALGNLEKLHRQAEQWPALLDVLRGKVEALKEPEEINEARLMVAELLEIRLERGEEAIAEYDGILRAKPTELKALKGLERLHAQRESWQALFEVLERQFELVATEKDRVSILIRLASMLEEEFLKPEQSAERLEQVLGIDPNNETALRGLERLYRSMQRWDELIGAYDRHVNATPDRREKVACFAAIGEVYANELDDADHAIDSYLNLLAIDEQNAPALDALTRLYEKREDYPQALDMMQQLVKLLDEPARVVDLQYRMGRILDEHLADRHAAVDCYNKALDVEPGHLPSLASMRTIYLDSGDWLAAAKMLERETEYTQQPRQSSLLLVELGRIYDERLDEHERAVECYENALKKDADNEEAALPLADEFVKLERYRDAFPLLDMLVKRSAKRENEEQHRLAFMLGDVSLRVGETESAIKALSKAYQLDQQHLPTLLKLADAYYQAADWEKAFKYFQMLLVHHRDSLGRDEITDVFYKLGVVKREQGDRRKALNMFDKALEEDQHHRPTLEAMVGVYEKSNEFEQVIHYRKQVLEIAAIEERFDMLDVIGDLWNDKVKNAQKAIEAYAEATALEPDNHRLLHKLLMLYQKTKQWDDAIEIIQRVADLDERAAAKSKYAYTVAVILRDEIKDMDRSIDKFNEALDHDPKQLKAFEAINKILNSKKDWKQLERAYRKMLHRIAGKDNGDLEYNLWHTLGVIYRDRLKQYDNAVEAFKVASTFNAEADREHVILAELYTLLGPDRVGDAIAEHQWLLRRDPYRVDSYQALYKLYFDARAYDKAWCLAATLTFLKKADAEQQQFYIDNKPSGAIRPQNRLNDERWLKDLVHTDQDLLVSKIFEQVWPAVLSLRIKNDKDAGLNPKHQHDANSTVTFARTFGFVANVMGLPPPRLFLRTDVPGGLTHMEVYPFASLCGATLLSGFQPGDLMFVAGRHLSDYRGEHYIRTMLRSNTELKTVLMASLRIAGVVPAGDAAIENVAQQLASKMQPGQRDALRTLAKRFVDAGARADIKAWLQAAELTSCRAGFLVCNDLETAARMVTQLGAAGPVDLAPKDKVKELVLFSVSEEYFRLREHLGIRIALA